jgi:charged multivesicular body protein 4
MAGILSYFGFPDTKKDIRDALVGLQQQIQILDKKSDQLQKRIEQELKVARANAVSDKPHTLPRIRCDPTSLF